MLKVDNALYLIGLILGGTGAWILNKWGYVFGLVDKPTDRRSHERPTPKGGGVGILAAFLALLSLLGDKIEISPKIRLPIQFIAALILVQLSAFSLQPSCFSSWLYS